MKNKRKNAEAKATIPHRSYALLALGLLLSQSVFALRIDAGHLVQAARSQIGVTVLYDPSYVRLNYPNGDVPTHTGVCADVIVRALRAQGHDLQALMHADMRANFSRYPKRWGLAKPDPNIDHRRVPNIETFLTRQGHRLPVSNHAEDYRAGDIVTWMLDGRLPHIGIVSNRKTIHGEPLIIHNIGQGTREEAILFRFPITGRFRLPH